MGLTEDLIRRGTDGKQTGVDVSKISGEYIASHSDPENNNIYFISNWYSNTPYTGYTSDEAQSYRTRGDAAVTFSPGEKNRYYIFQKSLPLTAHAYRVADADGNVTPVDNEDNTGWGANRSGNGETKWENGEIGGSNWSGGEFVGTYESEEAFKLALQNKKPLYGDGVYWVEDAKGEFYPLPKDITDAIITYTSDQLNKVDSNPGADTYTNDSVSFSSDDYFFLCTEYYQPLDGEGKNVDGSTAAGTKAVRKVNRMIARKGSAFGSGLQSKYISNGDMLCWSDTNGSCKLELEYNSHTDTGDDTRGRPTLEKLTLTGPDLRDYLSGLHLKDDEPTDTGETYLDLDCEYWEGIQQDPHMKFLISQITAVPEAERQAKFDELFDWSVATRTGGIRVGDMFNNMRAKLSQDEIGNGTGPELDTGSQYYVGNVTHTANNYYIPTMSDISTPNNGLVINNYLGNNGRLEVANSTLMMTKMLVAPDGFTLTTDQQNEVFKYQVYVQGLTGEYLAQRLQWNPYSKSWQKRVESLEILTDNSSLLLDTNSSRALFDYGGNDPPRQIVEVVKDGVTNYYYADANGAATEELCNKTTDNFYYLYLPGSAEALNYQLFASTYEGGTTEKEGVGTTEYYPEKYYSDEIKKPDDTDNQKFVEAVTGQTDETKNRPAGSREYWTKQAVFIPYNEVTADGTGTWAYNSENESSYKKLEVPFPLVTVIPNSESTDSTVYSPFSSRTRYMTMPLYFGNSDELYDQIIPTDDRPDLFNDTPEKSNSTPAEVAENTASYTLKSGEGLLLTGLGNSITYRFTEKLTDEQVKYGYLLKEISHIRQPGSDSIDRPGTQKIPIYSVFGSTGYLSEQVHYTNTIDPELFVLTKEMVDADNQPILAAPDVEFNFTVTFTPTNNNAMTETDSTLHYWKGDKNSLTSTEEWTDSGTTYKMPENAPKLDEYEQYLTNTTYRLKPIKPDENTDHTYTVQLKANEAIVFYGLIAGTEFTVTEKENEKYPVVPKNGGEPVDADYTKTGTILRASVDPDAIDPVTTTNRADFKNLLQTGGLTVQKKIKNEDPDENDENKDFGFTVTFTKAAGMELNEADLTATKYNANNKEYTDTEIKFVPQTDGSSVKAEVKLKHNEKLEIEGIPLGTTYKVEETQKDGYNLQHVAGNPDDTTESDGNYLNLTGNSVEGTIEDFDTPVYLLFVNERAPVLPFVGGVGVGAIELTGVLLIGLATAFIVLKKRSNRRARK